MSLRGTKRAAGMRSEEAGTSKRRRTEQEDALWQLRPVSDLKMSSIYNRSASEAPAELFRKDLISAMKLPDNEPLTPSEYWVITDTWKQDWERGVQVPVNPDSLPAPKVKILEIPLPPDFQEFKLPKDKYIHLSRDVHYQADKHLLSSTPARAEAACSYDLDATDTAWLKLLNAERARAGASPVTEDQLEKVIEELEIRTWDKIQAIMKSEEGLGIEYDENVICDVCRSPDSEDGNEMVFCDSCNICVHQACYGITVIPDGQWLCRPCGDGVRPTCVLCPNLGGAMKCTPSGHKWAHVSCVLWIPEVSIGCAEKMEPITKISAIPASRWSLVCVLCRERKGACIQCSVKTCKTAYHVTCAFKHGLEMRAIIEDENADDGVKLRSYCQKHSVNSKKEKHPGSGSEEEEVKRKRRKDMTSEEKTQARAARLSEIEREFDRHVSVKDVSTHLLDVDQDAISYIYNYWKLKRRAGRNRPLLPPKSDDSELLTHRQEQADLDKMKMFVQLRQDLERVRNLCYMVSRREKLSRSFFRMREQTFHKQVAVLSSGISIPQPELSAILEANHGPSIYDKLYSHPNAPDHKNDFLDLLARIAPPDANDDKKKDRNGLAKGSKSSNPYKKHYVNGSRRSGSMYSELSSEDSSQEIGRPNRYRGRALGFSTDDDRKASTSPKKKVSPKVKGKKSPKKTERKKKKVPQSKALVESSSEDEIIHPRAKKDRSSSKTLQQMEKEMAAGKIGQSGTDSDDELMTIRSTRNNKFPLNIYSSSSEDMPETMLAYKSDKAKSDKSKGEKSKPGNKPEKSPSGNDSQQSLPRTKAAMKEFIPTKPEKKSGSQEEERPTPKKRGRKPSNKDKKTSPVSQVKIDHVPKNKESSKSKQKDNPTDLIVPQRQAAKKASENMRGTTSTKKEEIACSDKQQTSGDDTKPVIKSKGKEINDARAKVKKNRSKELEKKPISYVPQRQAAKKAAAHIKSGLGSKVPLAESSDDKKRDLDKPETSKSSPKKDEIKSSKTTQKESSSSSSNSSSSSCSSSSSSEEEPEKPGLKPTAKAREIKPAPRRQLSMFSPPGSRPTVDLPFLDKVSKPLSSTSASSDSDSSKLSDRSGSESPSPKRPRRRRKAKSISVDISSRKAPDKKLKTSEWRPACRVLSSITEGHESSPVDDARPSVRARTRSTASSGNMPDKLDARSRKSSKDDSSPSFGSNKTPKESSQSSELPAAKREADEEIKVESKELSPIVDVPKTEVKVRTPKSKPRVDDSMEKIILTEVDTHVSNKPSPRKSAELKHKSVLNRRMSIIEPQPSVQVAVAEEVREPPSKETKPIKPETPGPDQPSSPNKKITTEEKMSVDDEKQGSLLNEEYGSNNKHWPPKAPSPNMHPPAVEKLGDPEKYMTEDKSLDSDSADKSSVKMIAKIQANLNENTMIKSPKTPLDARTVDPMDAENPVVRNKRKRSVLDPEKKFIAQDASHVQGVEISKSAKIPSSVNPYPNRSMFSPQPKDNELFEFEMMAVDDGFNHDDIMKPFTSYPEFFFKEDSKEQGVQETLNLVDRLRMQLSTKKVPAENPPQEDEPIVINNDDKDQRDEEKDVPPNSDMEPIGHTHEPPVSKSFALDLKTKVTTPIETRVSITDTAHSATAMETCDDDANDTRDYRHETLTNSGKWSSIPAPHIDMEISDERKYDHTTYEEVKEPVTVQSDVQSVSEVGDSISLSKQSDDSQSQPLSVVDHSLHSNDQELTIDNQNYDNNNSMIHSDCATISSPYVSQDSKWREDSKITTRRSSASSSISDGGSICSHKAIMKSHMRCDPHQGNVIPEIDSYPPMPAYSCPVEPAMPLNQYSAYPPDASPFLSSIVSLPMFAGPCGAPQLPLPSPGPSLYGRGIPYSSAPLLTSQPAFTLCAAFTSSSQNMALTTAMIAPPTPKPMCSPPRDEIDVTGSDKYSIQASSPSVSIDSFEASNRTLTKMSNDSNETIISLQESKSPKTSKPIKFPGKSPGKSPGISPKQSDGSRGTKRSSNRSNRSQRGRGRSKSRCQSGFPPVDYLGNSIQSKLVGTVYDFNEEIANDGVDLKALRERRKSVETRDDRKSEHSYKDSSQSPGALSPQPMNKKPPIDEPKEALQIPRSPSPEAGAEAGSPSERGLHVHPVLPGPVDMRTYQPFEKPVPPPIDGYHTLFSFTGSNADQHLPDIDEEVEKQLHSALKASHSRPGSPTEVVPCAPVEPPKVTFTPQLPKVSLSDSRNQLKVKIKGPFLDANYATSSVQACVPPPPAPVLEASVATINPIVAASPIIAGSTNLRRMRKKELLRQYWTQDMNMDDPTHTSTVGIVPPPAVPSTLTRAVITIPKAVASMTSIPTREDYKITEAPVEKKKRRNTNSGSRELRQLTMTMNPNSDPSDDVKLSTLAGPSTQPPRRRRATAKPKPAATVPVAPKLKIKLGSKTVQQVSEEPTNFELRPPKKRHVVQAPNMEDIRRENMKYRRMVMADFEETEKTKKSEKRKKKKIRKDDLEVKDNLEVKDICERKGKLVLTLKRREGGGGGDEGAGPSSASVAVTATATSTSTSTSTSTATATREPCMDPFEYDPTAPDPLAIDTPSYSEATSAMRNKIRTAKVTPIRLKLARTSQGAGYVMKKPSDTVGAAPAPDQHSDVR